MTILIGDDHSVVRRGLKNIIEEAYPSATIVEAIDGTDVLQKLQKQKFNVVISDISMPHKSGLEIVKLIKDQYPKLPVIMLSVHSPEHYAVRCLKAGASSYLTKESAPEELVKAMEHVLNGRKYITPEVADLLIEFHGDEMDAFPHKSLSNREFEVFKLIAEGKKISDIGEQLFLSINTISTYRTRILEKMHMSSNAELTKYAINNGLT